MPGMKFRTQPAAVVPHRDRPGDAQPPGRVPLAQVGRVADDEVHRHEPLHAGQDAPRPPLPRPEGAHDGDRRRAAQAAEGSTRPCPGRRGEPARLARGRPLGGRGDQPGPQGRRGQKAVHLCFGNYGGQTIQKGFYKSLLPFFNALDCDHLVLEFARRGYDELDVFKDLKPSIALGVGVIDIKDNEVEAPSAVAAAIEKSVKVLGPERIRWVHPDCGFWMLHRSVADRKMRAMVEGRIFFWANPASRGE
jgi:hypothetical protein